MKIDVVYIKKCWFCWFMLLMENFQIYCLFLSQVNTPISLRYPCVIFFKLLVKIIVWDSARLFLERKIHPSQLILLATSSSCVGEVLGLLVIWMSTKWSTWNSAVCCSHWYLELTVVCSCVVKLAGLNVGTALLWLSEQQELVDVFPRFSCARPGQYQSDDKVRHHLELSVGVTGHCSVVWFNTFALWIAHTALAKIVCSCHFFCFPFFFHWLILSRR